MNTGNDPRRGFGCLGYGCLISIIIMVVGGVGVFWMIRSGIRNAVETFTSDHGSPVPTVVLDEAAKAVSQPRIQEFYRLFNDSALSGDVTLGKTDLAEILSGTHWNGKLSLNLEGTTLSGAFSLPLKDLGTWEAARPLIGDFLERFLSGTANAAISIENGVSTVTLTSLMLNGRTFDTDALKDASEWLTGFANSMPTGGHERLTLWRIERLRVADGELHIRFRSH